MDGNWGEVNNLSKQAPSPKSIKSSKHGTLSKSAPLSVTGKSVALSNSEPLSVTGKSGALSKSDPLSVTGTSIKSQKPPPSVSPSESSLNSTTNPKTDAITELQTAVENIGPVEAYKKVEEEAKNAEPSPDAEEIAKNTFTFTMKLGENLITVGKAVGRVIREELPLKIVKIGEELNEQSKDKKKTPSYSKISHKIGGVGPEEEKKIVPSTKSKYKPNFSTVFIITYIPALFTLFAFIFLIIFLLWVIIMGLLNRFLGDKYAVPNIKFNKKTTQTIYSIFFAITSLLLMFYLFIDYFSRIGKELDVVQIFKQVVGASYILWPMAVLIIGSGIAKAFYKISCNGSKPNLPSWAKIVESSALYILGICVLFTVLFLLKPTVYLYNKTPWLIKTSFDKIKTVVAVTLKLMIIYIVLRLVTIMLEDVISNKLVFFISKLDKDVEAPPVNCNAEEEEKNAKQSEVAMILEEIYMYITGIIVCIIIIFIIIVQTPHPYVAKTSKINNRFGKLIVKLAYYLTKYILENKDTNKDCNEKSKGPGFFSLPAIPTSGRGAIVSQNYLDSLADMKDADIQLEDLKKGRAAEDARALAQASREKAPALAQAS
jgi:hypothetical protein